MIVLDIVDKNFLGYIGTLLEEGQVLVYKSGELPPVIYMFELKNSVTLTKEATIRPYSGSCLCLSKSRKDGKYHAPIRNIYCEILESQGFVPKEGLRFPTKEEFNIYENTHGL